MKKFTEKISLTQNKRGVWDLDPFKGCNFGLKENNKGCYGICYANNILKFRGYDFSKLVYRNFENNKHIEKIGKKLKNLEFIRLGVMCDPSSDWEHTINIIEKIRPFIKNIVIITKHWTILTDKQIKKLKGIYVNTSISALDTNKQIKLRLEQYNRLKMYCNSILRVNTADFNDIKLILKQNELLNFEKVIDNILRFPKNNKLVKNGLVNVEKYNFLGKTIYASKYNKNTFFGYCSDCKDKCGIGLFNL